MLVQYTVQPGLHLEQHGFLHLVYTGCEGIVAGAMSMEQVAGLCAKLRTLSTANNNLPVQWLVALQAGLTLVGNFTLWAGAYHVYVQSEEKETA